MKTALVNAHVFDGDTLYKDHIVIINEDKIEAVLPKGASRSDCTTIIDVGGAFLTPGFIDLQVNGGGGVMFNNEPNVEGLKQIMAGHRRFGTTAMMPTLITDSFNIMQQAIKAVSQAIEERIPGIIGIHLEGPFLNAARKGAHAKEKFCLLDEQGFQIISSLQNGKTIVTIAPELSSADMISRICNEGIVVCAGHTDATYDEARVGLTAGLSGFTHLYNAMTPLLSREPGVVGAALEDENSWFGIIADGFHMHPAAFKVAIAAKQKGGAILVTDAMATVGSTDTSFLLDGETIQAVDGCCVNAAGSLAGSALDMNKAIKNAIEFAKIDWMEAVRMASVYPAKAIGLDHQLGYLKPGYKANIVAMDKSFKVIHTWIDGIKNV